MPLTQELCDLLICPANNTPLVLKENVLSSGDDKSHYPIINGVPWLLPNPQNSLTDWGIKLNHFNQVLLSEIQNLEKEAARAEGATLDRIKRLLVGKQAFIRRVSELLLPVVASKSGKKNIYDALNDRAPTTQNLLSYEANLYRDWVWGEEENSITADIVCSQIQGLDANKIVVLGAGAGRLALDVHKTCKSKMTVATDINPLLVMAAEYLLQDQSFSLYEFPLQPKKTEFVAIEHQIKGEVKPEGFHFIFSDATKPCFKHGAFDTVLTPWFIDIQPLEFGRFLRQLNQYIPVGGYWVNFGSLVFNQRRDALCYSIEEVVELANVHGFEIENIEEHNIPYLKSPYNAGHRIEHVWSWRAKKITDVNTVKTTQNLPLWLLDEKQPIPQAQYFQQFSFTHRIYAQLSAEVDGRTSINKIARKLAKQNKIDETEALNLTKKLFQDIYRQNN
ncbi:class I SAM-dependent methyltransferase [Agarilytica rhodophyticola]|uniref:class I SAM-dependent methyltransferase n=1 Tax=Agarilytica rhodophyticola TaxID=1737490 RepID=UPI000B3411A8|nr:hypothetical protein [Agarilytica rhodophyticola]